jgi:hypothetical protein
MTIYDDWLKVLWDDEGSGSSGVECLFNVEPRPVHDDDTLVI